ncbi:MAG: tetratricopeptide repeat protein [Bacteroidetes bacterium]|nr:tetratricopeptide repeat protein [Bacteroidota bacterium]
MTENVSDPFLGRLSEFVESQTGLHFPKDRWNDLARGMGLAARDLDVEDTESSIESLMTSPLKRSQIEIIASHLTVGETYFFREKRSFEVLEEHILPGLIRLRKNNDRRIRIWSAGCCTGEEPYSIALSVSKLIPDWEDWNITILATDINPRFLKKASDGVYGEWSFREASLLIKEDYFNKTRDNRFEILPSIKKMVRFSYLNLAEDAYPSLLNDTNGMDIIFCRNVLMYFTPERAKKVIRNFYRSLVEGGWLIVSPSEASHVLYPQFATVNFPGAILYRKDIGSPGGVRTPDLLVPPDIEKRNVRSVFQIEVAPERQSDVISTDESTEIIAIEAEGHRQTESDPQSYKEILALYEQGSYEQAEQKIIGLLPVHSNDAKLMALLARVYANQGKLAEACKWSKRANELDKLNPAYRYLLATILQEQGQLDAAKDSFRQALYLDQNFVLVHFALGNLAHRQGKSDEAKKHFQNAVAILASYRQDEILQESDGLTAGRLREIIRSTTWE